MAAKSQPRGAKGTVGHPKSALNLRLLLASFGLVVCVVLGFLTARAGFPLPAVILGVLAAVAAVDLVVIQRRRAARRREEPGTRHSLFE
jgi:hydrogenase/urease accessory protein HupE